MFGLISKGKLRREIENKTLLVFNSRDKLKKKFKDGDITEWAYYRKLWSSNGRLRTYNDILDVLE